MAAATVVPSSSDKATSDCESGRAKTTSTAICTVTVSTVPVNHCGSLRKGIDEFVADILKIRANQHVQHATVELELKFQSNLTALFPKLMKSPTAG